MLMSRTSRHPRNAVNVTIHVIRYEQNLAHCENAFILGVGPFFFRKFLPSRTNEPRVALIRHNSFLSFLPFFPPSRYLA